MRIFVDDGRGRRPAQQMTFAQTKQAGAIMDCFGRMIPQEGVDYDVEITFKGNYNPSVSMNIVALTDKGEWWRRYLMEMLKTYPPRVENPEPSIPIEDSDGDPGESEAKDAAVVS